MAFGLLYVIILTSAIIPIFRNLSGLSNSQTTPKACLSLSTAISTCTTCPFISTPFQLAVAGSPSLMLTISFSVAHTFDFILWIWEMVNRMSPGSTLSDSRIFIFVTNPSIGARTWIICCTDSQSAAATSKAVLALSRSCCEITPLS